MIGLIGLSDAIRSIVRLFESLLMASTIPKLKFKVGPLSVAIRNHRELRPRL